MCSLSVDSYVCTVLLLYQWLSSMKTVTSLLISLALPREAAQAFKIKHLYEGLGANHAFDHQMFFAAVPNPPAGGPRGVVDPISQCRDPAPATAPSPTVAA